MEWDESKMTACIMKKIGKIKGIKIDVAIE